MFKPRLLLAVCLCLFAVSGCKAPASASGGHVLSAAVPLHLEDHLDAARITGSDVPKELPEPLDFRFDKDGPAWKPAVVLTPGQKPPRSARQDGVLRVTLTKDTRNPWGFRQGVVYVDLPDLALEDWSIIIVEARTKDDIDGISPCFNFRERPKDAQGRQAAFEAWGDTIAFIHDGEVHSYLLTAKTVESEGFKGPWRQLGISVFSSEKEEDDSRKGPISIDILSVKVVSKDASYAGSRAGIATEPWGESGRRVLYAHVPGKLEYDIKVPARARLDVGLGVLKKKSPVKFKVSARETAKGAASKILLEETCSAEGPRIQRSLDLSPFAGKTATITLETEAGSSGNVAFWGAPTLSGERASALPNVVFYVIDGAAAELMSVYGYNRRTTPYLERLAAEGVVFEHAYSNSSWTQVSVTSFMTSLHNSVLGGSSSDSSPLPEQAVTMAESLHKAGYMTEVLTSNPYCGRMSHLDRGVDVIRDTDPDAGEETPDEPVTDMLHRAFWELRDLYPGEPYWVHFQPTTVHWPWKPYGSFAGLFSTLEERKALDDIFARMKKIQWTNFDDRIEKSGVDKALFWQLSRKAYDECMAEQDAAIGQLVERIKDRGEWPNTLFIVAADHSHESAQLTRYDPKKPPKYFEPNLASQISRIPMIFVWPGKIRPGLRLTEPVSMIDMLPTILDLAGLPPLEISQGQSLAPLLQGRPGFKPRPVVFDEFSLINKEFVGTIDVIDGRWGASLEIDPRPKEKKSPLEVARAAPLLLFDIWEDPHAYKSLHAEHPDLVAKYTKMLEGIWKEHQALAKKFSQAASSPLTSAQIETLRSLGYIR